MTEIRRSQRVRKAPKRLNLQVANNMTVILFVLLCYFCCCRGEGKECGSTGLGLSPETRVRVCEREQYFYPNYIYRYRRYHNHVTWFLTTLIGRYNRYKSLYAGMR